MNIKVSHINQAIILDQMYFSKSHYFLLYIDLFYLQYEQLMYFNDHENAH
jgi:hypothetical protein